MGFLSSILGGGAGEAAKGVGELAKDIRQAVTGELPPELRVKADEDLLLAAEKSDANQTGLLNADIVSGSFFQRGWRPMAGWVCASGLLYQFLIYPFLAWLSLNRHWAVPPTLDSNTLYSLLTGMLGLAASRTVEKFKHISVNGGKND